jgi:hypothetical protein
VRAERELAGLRSLPCRSRRALSGGRPRSRKRADAMRSLSIGEKTEGLGERGDASEGTSPLLQRGAGSGPHLTTSRRLAGPLRCALNSAHCNDATPTVMTRRLVGHQAVGLGREGAFSRPFAFRRCDDGSAGARPGPRSSAFGGLRAHARTFESIPQFGERRIVDDTCSFATPACPNHYGIIS